MLVHIIQNLDISKVANTCTCDAIHPTTSHIEDLGGGGTKLKI